MYFYNSSPSSSSQSEGESVMVPEMSPTQLLSLAIKKRRDLFSRKERDYRQELLQTGFIQSLCKHLGERRARRRKRGVKRSVPQIKQNEGLVPSVELPCVEPLLQTPHECSPPKKSREDDPFGLDEFFAQVSCKRHGECT